MTWPSVGGGTSVGEHSEVYILALWDGTFYVPCGLKGLSQEITCTYRYHANTCIYKNVHTSSTPNCINYGHSFLEHLNGQCTEIQLTMEETQVSIPFSHQCEMKSTHTDCYHRYSSHHHPKVKSDIADCLHHRATQICWQMNESMSRRFWWQMDTWSKQLWRSRRDKIDP